MNQNYQELSSQAIVLFGSRKYREAAEKFEQALAIPTDADDLAAVEWVAGVTYTHFIEAVPMSELVHEPFFNRAIELMESAIRRDLQSSGAYFRDPAHWRLTCQLDGLYAGMADVLEEQSDAAALSYLLARAPVIKAGAMLESSARIARLSARTGDQATAIHWFQHAASLPAITGDAHEHSTRQFVAQELSSLTKKSGCFIATAAFASTDISVVHTLQRFRDKCLQPHSLGRAAVRLYYLVSPPLAQLIRRSPWCQRIARAILRPIIGIAGACNRTAG